MFVFNKAVSVSYSDFLKTMILGASIEGNSLTMIT